MISYIKGTILEKGLTYIVVETPSLGYKVFVTPETLDHKIGEEIKLYTYHKVAEDDESLFGLPDFNSLQFFELLITVSGVGPKMALAILSAAKIDAIKSAILHQDTGMFTRISGVGTKTAERIIVELKSKVGSLETAPGMAASNEVFDALLALGYNQREVRDVITKLDATLPTGEQLKQALKYLGNK